MKFTTTLEVDRINPDGTVVLRYQDGTQQWVESIDEVNRRFGEVLEDPVGLHREIREKIEFLIDEISVFTQDDPNRLPLEFFLRESADLVDWAKDIVTTIQEEQALIAEVGSR